MTTGDIILKASLAVGLFALALLLLGQYKKGDFERQVKWLIRMFAAMLAAGFLLLAYYFYTTDLTFNYVWSYTSSDLPLVYKLAGTLAGLQGTYLYWSALIALGALWLNEKRGTDPDFIEKTQIVVISLGIYFTGMTLLDSPFETIYEANPDLPLDFIPAQGYGLNPLLQDPWMAVHPPIIFIAYAAMTIPFAVAVVYLFKSSKKETGKTHREWIKNGVYWCRISWLFLALAIAIGGFWSYKVRGWGGFWAWDPVETSSLVPWLLLTAAMHALSEHRIKREKYSILAPVLVALTFPMVVYATLVTRSGFFTSIHAFGKSGASSYLVALIAISAIPLILLALIKYLKTEEPDKTGGYSPGLVNRTNIAYANIMLLLILTAVSFWGVTYPALRKLFWGETYGVFPSWFNIFSYIFLVPLMLLAGLCLSYRTKEKKRLVRNFVFFAGLTFAAMLIKPAAGWNIVDYSSVVGPEKPFLMTLVGSASVLSFIPPSIYIIYSLVERWKLNIKPLKRRDFRIKELGVLAIHLGIVFILAGAVAGSVFSSQYSATLNLNNKGQIVQAEGSDYSIRLLDHQEFAEYSEVMVAQTEKPPGLSISDFYEVLASGPVPNEFTVHGRVKEVHQVQSYTYVSLTDGIEDLWVAMGKVEGISRGTDLIATGVLMTNFPSPSLGKRFDLILFGGTVQSSKGLRKELVKATDQIEVAVYKGTRKIAQGKAEYWDYRGTRVGKVMIRRGITGDLNVVYSSRDGDEITVTVKFVPLINELWFGVILFAAGIIALIFSPPTGFVGLEEKVVSRGLCNGCGTCADVCPEKAIEVDGVPRLLGECVDCNYCLYNCPETS